MKRRIQAFIAALLLLTFASCALTACANGKSEFGVSESSEKRMTITAVNADKDSFLLSGGLEVEDGEQVVFTSDLTKGEVRLELIRMPDDQSMEELPEADENDAVMTADFTGEKDKTETISGDIPAGGYWVKATCLDKTDGVIRAEVKSK